MKLYEWEYREDHFQDKEFCLKETGIIHKKSILKFNGPDFWNMFKKFGHTSTEFDQCECWNKFKNRGVKNEYLSGMKVNFVEV